MAIPQPVKRWDVAIVGEIFTDHVFSGFTRWPAPGEEVHTDDYLRELGGGAINTACGLARLNRQVHLIGMIGDADRAWFETRLAAFAVSADGLRPDPLGTGITVSVSTSEDRSFYTYPGANKQLPNLLEEADVQADLMAARHVHFAMPLAIRLAERLLPLLRQAGCTTSLDVGFSPDWLHDPAHLWILRQVDYFLPNQTEARLLCGLDTAQGYRDWALAHQIPQAILKLGADGAASCSRSEDHLVAPPAVRALDMTGAGDAFDAGFIDGVLDAAPIQECLRRACICGALCTTRIGALDGLPDLSLLRSTYEYAYGS